MKYEFVFDKIVEYRNSDKKTKKKFPYVYFIDDKELKPYIRAVMVLTFRQVKFEEIGKCLKVYTDTPIEVFRKICRRAECFRLQKGRNSFVIHADELGINPYLSGYLFINSADIVGEVDETLY